MTADPGGLIDRLARVEAQSARMAEENHRLTAQVAALESRLGGGTPPPTAGDAAEEDGMSRRALLRRLAGAGVAGAGAAVAASALGAAPAAAGQDGDVVLGQTNNGAGTGLVASHNNIPIFFVQQNFSAVGGTPAIAATATNADNNGSAISGHTYGTGHGVVGSSFGGRGVYGSTTAAVAAVEGQNQNASAGSGVYGAASGSSGTGVHGVSPTFRGVHGDSPGGTGVFGTANNQNFWGVYGENQTGTGVRGFSPAFRGIHGDSPGGTGVYGTANNAAFAGVLGENSGTGVMGHSLGSGVGVNGVSDNGVGVRAVGGRAPLLLEPSGIVGPPKTGTHSRGEVMVDNGGALWVCMQGGTNGGTWAKAAGDGASFTPLAPYRVLDTRDTTPIGSGESRVVTVGGAGGVPASAVAVAMNITITSPTASGFLTIYPDGVFRPVASNINFVPGQTIANFTIVKLGDGAVRVYNHAGATHVIFDVAGYYF